MKKPRFILSRKNQKGQVAIFVALIFQILFVFFAILINVGLLVHHKINLQQSADLAAYYGAMKQAESLNAIAHINFQIRQAWKLLAWRYRIVGTFGFQRPNQASVQAPIFPVTLKYDGNASTVNSKVDVDNSCVTGTDRVNTVTHPFFCIGHGGMKGWKGGAAENTCKVSCDLLNSTAAYTVASIPNLSVVSFTGGVSQTISNAITLANQASADLCNVVGKENIRMLARMIVNYRRETMMRSQTMLMLAGNLSQNSFLDLDGSEVSKGATNTFRNNLTEANLNSDAGLNFKTFNSLSDADCAMSNDLKTAGAKSGKSEFLKRIEFTLIQFYIHDCQWNSGQNFRSGSIYNANLSDLADGTAPNGVNTPNLTNAVNELKDEILSLISNENEKYTSGYEKNPWCPAYYVVTASSEPMIPFLPLLKIKLNAKSVAKPFGGTVGPWYGRTWPAGNPHTQNIVTYNDPSQQTDESLPITMSLGGIVPTKSQVARLLPNFGRFVGDNLGLSDADYVSEYHSALVNRKPASGNPFGSSKAVENGNLSLSVPNEWPALWSWNNILNIDDTGYDPLTKGDNNTDSYLRDLEISAIAPNQFDITYYSIDPDYYGNYYERVSNPTIFGKLKQSAGMGPTTAAWVRPDFGHSPAIYSSNRKFSVRHQLEVVKKVIGTNTTGMNPQSKNMLEALPYLITNQASLLTGWTFKNFTDFDTFPKDDINSPEGTMAFGRCKDDWQKENGNPGYGSPVDTPPLPPTPGNCVTGGRVGYSVKLVSPALLRETSPDQPLGGPGTSGKILNPIPADFLN